MSDVRNEIGAEGIRDAKTLGTSKVLLLGLQHMFAMFGATVLVPALTGLSVSATLLFAGLGTLLFHFLTKRKVPAFLGSSFAFIGGYAAIAPNGERELLPYACLGVFFAALLYLVIAGLIKAFGVQKVMQFFPPIVTGPIIMAIGLNLSPSAINNCSANWFVAIVAIVVIVACNIWGKGMIKIIPIILGVVASYIVGVICGQVDFTAVKEAAWVGLPFAMQDTVFSIFSNPDSSLMITAIIGIMPIAIATIVEHIGDMSAISSTVGENFIEEPGLHRTLLGDGLATMLASLFGAPANTTYGENTGVLNLTKVYDPMVIRLAAIFAIIFSFSPKFAALVSSMPAATVGGVSIVLYGMISAVGVRNVVENNVDFKNNRNVIIAALILVLSIGISYSSVGAISFTIGAINISLSGLAVGSLVGIILNAVLPGKDYSFDAKGEESANLKV
ncbi:MAG: uracil-xanthine permease family protein [Lachnospiraceae bacterium]|mgnify:FL=1|nr:uracil-xanthine permease [Lachnospiraceae bacterium]MCI6331353.1 uracil-xanthine permease family protein [Lachnospiraceae bacterium]MCI6664855.1 uracil-xanthine permease family protein [Lachnospiraceae bacterium]MCI6977301.1 uracil-xanthine permease family protein [Lachnospiraceae bacterium]MDD7223801.1 uracil-xanthine permease family protein [Lachnospiraceae bacterium]